MIFGHDGATSLSGILRNAPLSLEPPGTCGNCGDGSGWHAWYPLNLKTYRRDLVWVGCADCNDDGVKPKPQLCACGYTAQFCVCKTINRRNN